GADMKTFGVMPPPRPNTRDLLERLEASRLPIVAAIEGVAMGGGLELALTCDYRVAAPRAKLALPEIQRGLLPGAGGTQRLPRLIGVAAALPFILTGEPVDAATAKRLGIVDEVANGDVVDAAVAFAKKLPAGERRRASAMTAPPDEAAIAAARAKAQPQDRGGLAEHRAIDCVADAAALPFDEGMTRERERFVELMGSEQSKARIHIFFAEREAAKLPDGSPPPPFSVKAAAIIGSGTMGSGIAMACANAGIAVTLIDLEQKLLDRAQGIIAGNYAATAKKGRLSEDEMHARLGRIIYKTSLDAVAGAELVIEAVFEEMGVKQDVFRQLDRLASPGAILASNTSTLDIDAIAGVTSRPQDVVGLHFFSPANVMKLLEIVRGAKTSPQTIAQALGFAKQIKKVGVVAGNCDGFIGNRMLHGYTREAGFLLEEGASPEQVDRVIKGFGFAMGPFAMGDLAGLDVGWRIRKGRHANAPPVGRYSKVADRLCEMGRFGQKTGAGFYWYAPGDRTPNSDQLVADLIEQCAREAGIERRAVSDGEILKRCMYPLVNEAAKILDEGIATRPGDVDVVWIYGYGFPAFRGGPLRWADSIGLKTIVDDMREFAQVHGESWEPAPLLVELADSGGTFGSWKGRAAAHA
ncbi:MAG TPA: 3-hydroxyacyl-CoA dehydrogenase NAD-binding domain-containing protein, partial [Candidatus Elarobacter sp.]